MYNETHMGLGILFLQLAFLWCAALLFGQLARRLKQPAVLGELIGGVVLGPTVLGAWAPELSRMILVGSPELVDGRAAIIKMALLLFLFTVGLEMDFANLWRQRRVVLSATALGIAVPFVSGFCLVQCFPSLWASGYSEGILLAAFIGTALSISALPVIARILQDFKLIKTSFGSTVMASATLTDIIGWALFAVILKSTAAAQLSAGAAVSVSVIDLTLAVFILGVICAPFWRVAASWQEKLLWVVRNVAAPVYFISVGLKVNFAQNFDVVLVAVVFVVACLGKVLGVTVGASWAGMPFKQSLAAGFALNARGAMEIVLATVALEAGLINERIFVALFVMALGTSILSGPVMQRLIKAS